MEAHKERKEQIEKEEDIRRGSRKQISNDDINDKSKVEVKGDTVTKRVIREFIVSGDGSDNNENRAQAPHDVLAFSRTVHNVDSSLE
ncbi:hypothetical protein SESBI_02055 [Sesbania bispinosa]|nr:hypothetical protein SESBI_02055 [Sesbania bispinosa]